ncbi:hypothetical protein HDU67_002879 [Dinochytrium kinnereticum]|nr:hypothetical protein HDU67_002879 [Dinochytrium kinnereticum]
MGHLFSKIFARHAASKKEVRILVLGLDNAGKTSILYRLKLQEHTETAPTVGFNVETVRFRNLVFQMWDCGGQDSIRPLWRHYFKNSDGLVFVVDSTDKDRLGEAGGELRRILEAPEMEGVAVLVVANKQDLKDALSPEEVTKGLRLNTIKSHNWNIVSASATTGEGLTSGLQWLSQNMVVQEPAEHSRR